MPQAKKPRVAADIVLALLESVREMDLPAERLPDEDVRVTMPRRLGISDVIYTQIAAFQEHQRRGRRVTDEELASFISLVTRRPDAASVFAATGSRLAATNLKPVAKGMPRAMRVGMLKRRIKRALNRLFGRTLGGFTPGAFTFEIGASPLVQVDPGGAACRIITGFFERALRDSLGDGPTVLQTRCEVMGDAVCRWTVDGI